MKMKYYLRGLGTGIVLATVLLVLVSGANRSMTDEEVKKRAAQLGMVTADHTLAGQEGKQEGKQENATSETVESTESTETSKTAQTAENTETTQPSESTETTEATQSAESTESSEAAQSSESTETSEAVQPAESTESSEAAQSTESTETSEAAQSSENTETSEAAQPTESSTEKVETTETVETMESSVEESVLITIKSGYSSDTVAKLLAGEGLVESATKYDAYLCQHGYDKSICVGVFEIPRGLDYEEIAKIITKKK